MPRITAQDSIYKVPRPTPVVAECPKCGNVCEDSSISVSLEQTYDIQGKRWIDNFFETNAGKIDSSNV